MKGNGKIMCKCRTGLKVHWLSKLYNEERYKLSFPKRSKSEAGKLGFLMTDLNIKRTEALRICDKALAYITKLN